MKTLMNIFLWFSNTDPEIYKMCKASSKYLRQSLSAIVLLTGIMAFITGSYFIRTIFATFDETQKELVVSPIGWIVSVFIGIIWMSFIINLDKMIIASMSKNIAWFRIPLAIIIGLAVSAPLEIYLFSGKINKTLLESSRVENHKYEDKYLNYVSDIDEEIKFYKTTIANEKTEISKWREIMEAETVGRVKSGTTGLAGQGPAYNEALENYDLHKTYLNDAVNNLSKLQEVSEQDKNKALDNYKRQKIDQSFDFVSQYQQLSILLKQPENRSLKHLSWAINLLFILIESVPALMKISAEKDTYDYLLNSRFVHEVETVNVLTNINQQEIKAKGTSILSGPDEVLQPKNAFPQIGATIS